MNKFYDNASHYAAQAVTLIREHLEKVELLFGANGPSVHIGLIEQQSRWNAIMATCFVSLLCIANVLTALLEMYIQQPIWQYMAPENPFVGWGGALAMVLIGAYCSHCFAKSLVGELRDLWIEIEMNKPHRPNLDAARSACLKDTRKDLIIGLVILLPTTYFVYQLTLFRVQEEAYAMGIEPIFTVLDWLPTIIYLLNATVMGIFWEYFFKKFFLNRRIAQLKEEITRLFEAARDTALKVDKFMGFSREANEPNALKPSTEIQYVLLWLNQTSGVNHALSPVGSDYLEVAFMFTEGSQPLRNEPLLFGLDNSAGMSLSQTDHNGMVQVRALGARAVTLINLPARKVVISSGPWLSGSFTPIDIRQFPFKSTLSLE